MDVGAERRSVALCCIMVAVLLVPAGLASAATHTRVVPVAASNEGLHGTHWMTDLSIFSRTRDQTITVRIAFLPDVEGDPEPTEVTVDIEALSVVEIHDVLAELFGESRPGALRLKSDFPFEATSRTFNDGGGTGVHGEGIPAVDPEDVFSGSMLLGAANRPGPEGERTNIGLVNCDPWDYEVSLHLYDMDTGEWSEPVTVELGPYGWIQQDVFELFGMEGEEVTNTMVAASTMHERVFAYLSRVDNLSGDGTYIMPVNAEAERTLPRAWDITMTLNYTEGVTAYVLTHDGGPGFAVEPDPDTGWSISRTFISPESLCYNVYGEVDARGGEVEIEILYTEEHEPQGRRVQSTASSGPGPIRLEGCFTMD